MIEERRDPRIVRPYVVTGGRTRARDTSLRVETIVQTKADGEGHGDARFEHATVLELCQEPLSIAEIAGSLALPLGVTIVLVDDLVARGLLFVHESDPVDIELSVLARMIERVRSL